ncbi:trichohyalin-like [Scomber scombrus]|uniref:trichohyalin-like n=1 Tax=Scomber scombrus TaxID=13677 RepID=UPI002DDB2C15|nr:trichohyalin-like [Scomber scombrus]
MLNVIEKLKENKNEAAQEKMQLMQTWTEIHQEREALERRHNEIITEQYKLKLIIYEKTTSKESKKESNQQLQQGQEKMEMLMGDSLQSLIDNNRKIILGAKQAKEQIEKNMADLKQELKRNREDVSQHKYQMQYTKHNMNEMINKLKQRLIQQQSTVQMQKATVPQMDSKDRQKEETDALKMKLSRIQEEMERLWGVLKDSEKEQDVSLKELKAETEQRKKMTADSQKLRQDTDVRIMITTWETEKWQQMKTDMQRQKQDIEKKLVQVQSERDEIERIKTKIEMDRENLERDKQLAKADINAMMCMRESVEGQKQELDDKLRKTKKEMRELEVTNAEIEIKKKDLVKMMRMIKRKKEEINKMKEEIENAKQDMEGREEQSEGRGSEQVLEVDDSFDEENMRIQQATRTRTMQETVDTENQIEEDNMERNTMNKVNADIQRVILQVEDIRKMLRMVKEEIMQSRMDFTEEKSQMKWMNFQVQKKRRELDQRLERTLHERDELEIMKIKIQRHRRELEQKTQTMAEVKVNIEKAAAEMNNTLGKIHTSQKKIDETKEEVKNYMDKLTSMTAQVSRWISTESAIKKTFSLDGSKLQQPQNETRRDSLKRQTSEIPTDREGTESEIIKEATSLQQSITSDVQHESQYIKEEEQMHSAHKEGQEFRFVAEEQNIPLQMQTEIHEKTLMEDDQKELVTNKRNNEKIENEISKLKEKEEKIREQIKCSMEDMENKNQEIKRLIVEIKDVQSQRPETETWLQITEIGDPEKETTGMLKETEHTDILRVITSASTDVISEYEVQMQKKEDGSKVKEEVTDESDLMRLDVKQQKYSEESREELQTQIDGCSDEKGERNPNLQRLREEIYRTQEIIRLVTSELENQVEESTIDRDHEDEDSTEIKGLIQELKIFQELLKRVKNDMREETTNIKSMKKAAKKQNRELDQRLEKTLRERDELDILKIKIQSQNGLMEQKMEKMETFKSTIEEMGVKTLKKSADIEIIIKETDVKLRYLEDLNYRIEAKKQDLENCHHFISLQRDDLEKCKTQRRDRAKTYTDRLTKDRHGKEIEEMETEIFKLRSEKEKLMEDVKLTIERLDQRNCENEQLRNTISKQEKEKMEREEIEMLKQQIEAERENVRLARQQAEAEIHEMNSLRENIERQKHQLHDKMLMTQKETRELELLKSELEMKRKQSEDIFKESISKKEENDLMWNEIQREKNSLRKEAIKKRRELDQRLEKTMRERDELEVMRIKLRKEKEEVAEMKQRIVNDQTSLLQGYRDSNKINLERQSSKVNDFVFNIQNTRQKINVHLETFRREMGVLKDVNVVLEKQREGLKALQAENKTLRNNMSRIKSQIKMPSEREMDELIHMRVDIQKQKQELDIRLEYTKREIREMEVLKSELDVQKRENQQMNRRGNRKEQEVKKMLAEIKQEKDALKRETQRRKKELDQRLERIMRERDEFEIIKLKLQSEKDKSKGAVEESRVSTVTKLHNQIQKHCELIQTCMEKYQIMKRHSEDMNKAIQNEKRHILAQAEIITQARDEVENIKMEIKRQKEMMICAVKNMQQKQAHLEQMEMNIQKEQKSLDTEKERILEKSEELVLREKKLENDQEFLIVERQKMRKERKEMKRPMNNTQSEKALKILIPKKKLKTQDDKQKELMNAQLEEDMKERKILKLGYKESDHENLEQQRYQKDLPGVEQLISENERKDDIQKEIHQLENDEKKEDKDVLQIQHTELARGDEVEIKVSPKKIEFLDRGAKPLITVSGEEASEKDDVKDVLKPDDVVHGRDPEKKTVKLMWEREERDRAVEMMKKEKLDLEYMRSDVKKQIAVIEREKQVMKDEKDKMEMTKAEMQKKKEQADSLFDEINREKTNIKDLTLQLQTKKKKLNF